MSWHDPARSEEPAEDTALREELRGLLGLPARGTNYFETEPTPELVRLADDLRREALRRNRTARKQHSWLLAAAALPVTLALGGLGTLALVEKHKADELAATVAHEAEEIHRLAAAVQQAQPGPGPAAQPGPGHVPAAARTRPPQVLLMGKASPKVKPKELVIPVERPAEPNPNDTHRVKAH
jgi:hypothetical protein